MNRAVLTLLLGLAAGLGSHFAYYLHHESNATDSLEGRLAWMKSELNLTDAQFARIKELHQASHPRLQQMAAQVAQMQAEFIEFEKARQSDDRVDFIEFARFVSERRNLNQACQDSTRQLVLASAEVMTPEQRRHYIRMLSSAEPFVGSLVN